MAITVTCEKCGKRGHVGDELAGKRIKCPKCRNSQLVPHEEADVQDGSSLVVAEEVTGAHAPTRKRFRLIVGILLVAAAIITIALTWMLDLDGGIVTTITDYKDGAPFQRRTSLTTRDIVERFDPEKGTWGPKEVVRDDLRTTRLMFTALGIASFGAGLAIMVLPRQRRGPNNSEAPAG